MRRFADLYRRLDRSTATSDKRAALLDYFRSAPPEDAAWALWLLSGGKIGGAKAKIAGSGELRAWISGESGVEPWLVDDCYSQVGDLAETLALLLDDPPSRDDAPLHAWIEDRLLAVAGRDEAVRRAAVVSGWRSLDRDGRLVFNKLLTGALRVGVSQRLAQLGWVHTSRGKGGGLALAHPASHYRLGEVIRALEDDPSLLDCAEPPCALRGHCGLKPLLDQAQEAFYAALDQHTLADTHVPATQKILWRMKALD